MQRKDDVVFSNEEFEQLRGDLAKILSGLKEIQRSSDGYVIQEFEIVVSQIAEKHIRKKEYAQVVKGD